MADAGFFKGTSAEQDSRFANKQKKLLKQMKFPDNIDVKVNEKIISYSNYIYIIFL
jgi:serine/arginine repetitive matrix protein 1